jgi:hypothetical protein
LNDVSILEAGMKAKSEEFKKAGEIYL